MNDQKEAFDLVNEAVDKYRDVAEFYYLRGIINNAREKYSRALDDFNTAIEMKPDTDLYKCYLGRGVCYLNLLDYDPAITDLTMSIELNDTVASAYHSRAVVNYQMQDYAASVSDFLKTLELSEGNASIFFNLGMSYYRMNDVVQALTYYKKAIFFVYPQ